MRGVLTRFGIVAVALLATACSGSSQTHSAARQVSDPGQSGGTGTTPSGAPPSWTAECLKPNGQPAQEFVGLTMGQARQRAASEGANFRVYGAAGRCLSQTSEGTIGPEFAVTVDGLDRQLGTVPDDARVLSAYWVRKPR